MLRSRFGHGAHACPGKSFGLIVIKVLVGKLILNYDIQWAKPRKQGERPMNWDIEGFSVPDWRVGICLRKREKAAVTE